MRIPHWRWIVACCVPLLMAAGGQRLAATGAAAPGARPDTALVPLQLGDWQGVDTPVSAQELARLERSAELRRRYGNPAGERLVLDAAYSSQWEGLHAAESCLTGAGWSVVRHSQVQVEEQGGGHASATVLVNREAQGQVMVELYMFVNGTGVTANWVGQFWMLLKHRGRGDTGCMFILNGGVAPGQSPEAVAEMLRVFAREMLPYVQQSLQAGGT
jgi:EpsI family protein